MTGIVGFALLMFIERVVLQGSAHAEIEHLFGNSYVMAAGLASAGTMIIWSSLRSSQADVGTLGWLQSAWIGAGQGLCLPFRGFSRSGAMISMGLFLGVAHFRSEEFSFALSVV
ncbi:MAG TPA: undecaprenyl-diphosphate phosphatase [Steroidobacteraceae bacterium]|jgi:undecaprenyl-diphosphatase|nr:undecaprenyl-diphosphate phosphatase [Steroidobacteraceae bacterium]